MIGGRGWLLLSVAAGLACGRESGSTLKLPASDAAGRNDDPPVAINAESPVEYPRTLYDQGIEGKVILRLHVDEHGQVVDDSTRVAESSGYPDLDSAAVRAAPQMKFAPAERNGSPIAATFLQPVHFRHPQAGGTTP